MRATSLEIINHWVMGGQRHQDIAKNMKKGERSPNGRYERCRRGQIYLTWSFSPGLALPCSVYTKHRFHLTYQLRVIGNGCLERGIEMECKVLSGLCWSVFCSPFSRSVMSLDVDYNALHFPSYMCYPCTTLVFSWLDAWLLIS